MYESPNESPAEYPRPSPTPTAAAHLTRPAALMEVLVCSGFPTQLLIVGLLQVAGLEPRDATGSLSLPFFATLAGLDSVLLVGLVFLFLRSRGESPRALLLGPRGHRPVAGEAMLGVLLVPVVLLFVATLLGGLRLVAPWLRTVPDNPLGALLDTPLEAVIFAFVVVIAGGLREEIQRAFILHRFEQALGGARVGLAAFSVLFGLGHLEQGVDVAIATAVLGVFWGVLYLARRSIVAPVVSHAGLNLAQVVMQSLSRLG